MQAHARRTDHPGRPPTQELSPLRGRGLRGPVDAIIDSNTVSSRNSTEDVALGGVEGASGAHLLAAGQRDP
jgi:hypothetical protein